MSTPAPLLTLSATAASTPPPAPLQPIQLNQVSNDRPISVKLKEEDQEGLALFVRFADGRRVFIRKVNGTELEEEWKKLKKDFEKNGASNLRLDLGQSKLEFQDANQVARTICLYKEELRPFYNAIDKIKIPPENPSKEQERTLGDILRLPMHTRGHRASSSAPESLRRDDPRLSNLSFEQRHLSKALETLPADKAGLVQRFKRLKRKKAAEYLQHKYQAALQTAVEAAKKEKSLAGQAQTHRFTTAQNHPLDAAAIHFNAVHPFPSFNDFNELKKALEERCKAAQTFIDEHPIPEVDRFIDRFDLRHLKYSKDKEINPNKEKAYAQDLALAGLPESWTDPNTGRFLDARQIYELSLELLGGSPATCDSAELLFIRLAEKIADGNQEAIEKLLAGPSLDFLPGELQKSDRDFLSRALLEGAEELLAIYKKETLDENRDDFSAVKTQASSKGEDADSFANWDEVAFRKSGAHTIALDNQLIAAFDREFNHYLKKLQGQ